MFRIEGMKKDTHTKWKYADQHDVKSAVDRFLRGTTGTSM